VNRLIEPPAFLEQTSDHFFDAALAMSRDDDDQPGRAGSLRQTELHPAAWMAGWFVENELRGVIRASRASHVHVEANLFVDRAWRRQGIGSMLLKEAMDWARRREASAVRFICDRADWEMRHLAGKFGARLDLVLGQVVVDFPLQVPQ
jgi:GNAT superfamily N-acetyltransferase